MLDNVNWFCELMGFKLPLYQRIFMRIRLKNYISHMRKTIEGYKNKEELFIRLSNSDGTVDLHMNQKMFNRVVDPFCRKDIKNHD